MFAAALLFTGTLAEYQLWEMDEPLTLNLANIAPVVVKAAPAQIVTQEEASAALHKTNCSEFVTKRPMHLSGNETCWSYDYDSPPKGCPSTGWVKYEAFHFAEAKVGKAGISVDEKNHVGLVVSNVTFKLKPTKFTAQEHGFFTIPCDGIIDGIISGATNAVEAFVNLTAEGVPIVGEGAASPVDGVVVDLKHTLEGLCGFLDDVISALLDLCGELLHGVIQNDLPPIISKLLKQILTVALDGPAGLTTAKPALEGWSRVI